MVFAVQHGLGAHHGEGYQTGLAAYDVWAKALRDEKFINTNKDVGFGNAYNAQCWFECRRNAVGFLNLAKKRLDDPELDGLFDEAIDQYSNVRDLLQDVATAYAFNPSKGEAMGERLQQQSTRLRAAAALEKARDAERAGLVALARIARKLGAEDMPDTIEVPPISAGAAGQPSDLDKADAADD